MRRQRHESGTSGRREARMKPLLEARWPARWPAIGSTMASAMANVTRKRDGDRTAAQHKVNIIGTGMPPRRVSRQRRRRRRGSVVSNMWAQSSEKREARFRRYVSTL